MDVMPFDELNKVKAAIPMFFEDGRIRSKKDFDSLLDMLEDLFLLAYANGNALTNMSLASDIEPNLDDVMRVVDKKIADKTWRDRMKDIFENGGTVADIVRIAETETHRDANAGAYETAKAAGATEKVWHTMLDDRVRDSHYWLEGVAAPIDGEFYNWKGESTMYPGEWGIAEEDVRCRCWVTYS